MDSVVSHCGPVQHIYPRFCPRSLWISLLCWLHCQQIKLTYGGSYVQLDLWGFTLIRQQLGVRQIYCLFVSDVRRGATLSKQRLAHWATQAISHAYKSAGLSVPIHCHSTRALATSWVQGSVAFWDLCCSDLEFILHIFSFLQIKCGFLASGVCCSAISLYKCFTKGIPRDYVGIRLPLVLSAPPLAVWSERK